MRVGIDISQIVYQGTGVGRFTRSLVEAILAFDKKNRYVFFFSSLRANIDDGLEKEIKNKGHQIIKRKLPPTCLSLINNNLHSSYLSSIVYHLPSNLDWFITSDWTEPALLTKKATIIHDLVFKRYPETQNNKIVSTQEKRMKWVSKESKVIFADSATTKDDLIKYYSIDEERIIINYPGVAVDLPSQTHIKQTLDKYHLARPFILSVGKLEPRKNIDRLIQSFHMLNDKNIDLVVVGPKGWNQTSNNKDSSSNIKYLGFIPDADLSSLYSTCLFFIYPSIWEGFGYPVVEAMKHGTPVATSNTSSLREIGDGAALLFDPFNINEISKCIDTLAHDEKLRKDLGATGKEQAQRFRWEKYVRILSSAL